MNVIAYRRVSTDQQGESGLGLEAQTEAVEAYCRPGVPEALRSRLARMRAQGMTFRAIAASLEREGVPTAQGGVWRPGTVKHILGTTA